MNKIHDKVNTKDIAVEIFVKGILSDIQTLLDIIKAQEGEIDELKTRATNTSLLLGRNYTQDTDLQAERYTCASNSNFGSD